MLLKQGWRRDSLKAGDQVSVEGSAAKDGSHIANARTKFRRMACRERPGFKLQIAGWRERGGSGNRGARRVGFRFIRGLLRRRQGSHCQHHRQNARA